MTEQAPHERLRDARAAMYRGLILDTAEEVFAEHGHDAASMKAIASRAGVSLATLYAHFGSKGALFEGVHARRLGDLMRVALRRAGGGDALDRTLSALAWHTAFHYAHPHYLRMHLHAGVAWAQAEALRTAVQREAWTAGQAAMAAAFADGTRDGIFADDDPRRMACAATTLTQVALASWVEGGMTEPLPALLRWQGEQLVRSFVVVERIAELLPRVEATLTVVVE